MFPHPTYQVDSQALQHRWRTLWSRSNAKRKHKLDHLLHHKLLITRVQTRIPQWTPSLSLSSKLPSSWSSPKRYLQSVLTHSHFSFSTSRHATVAALKLHEERAREPQRTRRAPNRARACFWETTKSKQSLTWRLKVGNPTTKKKLKVHHYLVPLIHQEFIGPLRASNTVSCALKSMPPEFFTAKRQNKLFQHIFATHRKRQKNQSFQNSGNVPRKNERSWVGEAGRWCHIFAPSGSKWVQIP